MSFEKEGKYAFSSQKGNVSYIFMIFALNLAFLVFNPLSLERKATIWFLKLEGNLKSFNQIELDLMNFKKSVLSKIKVKIPANHPLHGNIFANFVPIQIAIDTQPEREKPLSSKCTY